MNDDYLKVFFEKGSSAIQILEGIHPPPAPGAISSFMGRVSQALLRLDDQVEWLKNKPAPAREYQLADRFIGHLNHALEVLREMGEGTDTVIHEHFCLDQGAHLPRTKIGGRPVGSTLQALVLATRSHQHHDIDKSSKLNPTKRKYMPLFFHIGQAWKACFWAADGSGPPINANANSVFFQFTEFLVVDVIDDRHHRNESLIRTAIKEEILPSR